MLNYLFHVQVGCWILREISEKETQCEVIVEIDLEGSIPTKIKNMVNRDQGYMIAKV